ncbi:hypothetical protein VTI74DRAFT_3031 [Chaetomium olivicolor]
MFQAHVTPANRNRLGAFSANRPQPLVDQPQPGVVVSLVDSGGYQGVWLRRKIEPFPDRLDLTGFLGFNLQLGLATTSDNSSDQCSVILERKSFGKNPTQAVQNTTMIGWPRKREGVKGLDPNPALGATTGGVATASRLLAKANLGSRGAANAVNPHTATATPETQEHQMPSQLADAMVGQE